MVRLLDLDLEAERLERLGRGVDAGGASTPGTSTSSGPWETTSVTVSPRKRLCRWSGVCEMTSPSATVSEYSSAVRSTCEALASSAPAAASVGVLAGPVA